MHFTVPMDDTWFNAPSSEYNHNLARLSMGMAGSAFRCSGTKELQEKDCDIRSFFAQAGFTNYEQEQYDIVPTIDTIATAMAMKKMTDENGEEYTLIAIAVSGYGYENEWMSNFTVSDQNVHKGFNSAAQKVLERFDAYRAKYAPEGRVKVWISGYSRASAVSNLTAHYLLIETHSGLDDDDIFAYCFAVPACTRAPVAHPQIFNICGSFDPVPMIPFSEWNYGRHGITRYITAMEVDLDYSLKTPGAAAVYERASGGMKFASSQEGNWFIHKVLEMLYAIIPTSESYSVEFQQAVLDAWVTKGSAVDKLSVLIDEVGAAAGDKDASRELGDMLSLVEQCAYSSMLETFGVDNSSLSDLLTSGLGIAHEHFPGVYMAWLLSTDEDELFIHANGGTRVVGSTLMCAVVENATTGEVLFDTNNDAVKDTIGIISTLEIGSEDIINLPYGTEYRVTLCMMGGATQLAVTNYTIGTIATETLATDAFTANDFEIVTMLVHADGSVEATREDGTPLVFETGHLDGSVMQELKLAGNYAADFTVTLVLQATLTMVPKIVAMVLLVLYLLTIGIAKLIRRKKMVNTAVTCNIVGRVLMYICGVACLLMLQIELRYVAATVSSWMNGSNAIRAMIANMLNYGTLAGELINALLMSIMAWLCFRSPGHKRSHSRCRRMALLLLVMNLLEALWELMDYEELERETIGGIVLMVGILVALAVTRVGRKLKEDGSDASRPTQPKLVRSADDVLERF